MKDIKMSLKPHKSAEQWLDERSQDTTSKDAPRDVKRVTVDLPIEVHQKLKIKCVVERINIADLVRRWIEEKLNE
jgi:hypothetical protein